MRIVISVAVAVVFIGAMVFTVMRESAVECEVCVSFGGSNACRVSSAADREQALRMAQSTACAVLASGVTRGLACQNVAPVSVSCEGDAR